MSESIGLFHELDQVPNSSIIRDKFYAILEKMPKSNAEKEELSARIGRRIILCEAQLINADIRFEKLEAKLMDYAGKQNIAKQAITQQSPLEIVWLGAKKAGFTEGEKIIGIPKALEKANGELKLVVEVTTKESVQVVHIPIAKISLLRRIKKSIFE